MSSRNQRVNALIRGSKNKKELIEKAKPYGLTFSYSNCNKKQIAQAIVLAQDKQASAQSKEPEQPAEQPEQPAEQPGDQSGEFLQLTEPEDEPIIEDGRGGKRENAGRPEGQTETHAKVDHCRNIKKSDPTLFFFVSGAFSLIAMRSKVYKIAAECDDRAESLALSITKLMRYQWPDFQLDPRIEFGAGILTELRQTAGWCKETIEKESGNPEKKPDNLADDISDEVFPDENKKDV